MASPHQPLRLGLPCSTLTHAVAPQPPAYLGDSFSCTPEAASHSYTACAPPIPACFPRPPADMRARRPLVCTARPPIPLPEPFPSCLVVLWARVLASRGLVSTGHEFRPIRCCAAWAPGGAGPPTPPFPPPQPGHTLLACQGSRRPGGGREGRLVRRGVVEREREASLFHALLAQWTAHVLGAD